MFNFFKKKEEPKKPLIELWTQYSGLENVDLVDQHGGSKKAICQIGGKPAQVC